MVNMATTDHADRDHWNRRYAEQTWRDDPSPWIVANAELLPETGSALDVAGGTGRNAIWLAQRGWCVTIADVSDVALDIAIERADALRVSLRTHPTDLSTDSLPDGPWDLLILFHYLDRALFPDLAAALRPGGMLVGALATIRNLERNERPPSPYLLEETELPGMLAGLELIRYEEGWRDDRHDARFVGRKPLS
jgi:tellurite methyltransferase